MPWTAAFAGVQSPPMTALDVLVLLLVGLNAWRGFNRGFTWEVITLAGWVAGILAVRAFHTPAAEALAPISGGSSSGAAALAFLLLFFVPLLATRLLASRMGKLTRSSAVGPFDRVLGGGFGALKGLLAASLLFLAATVLTGFSLLGFGRTEQPEWIANARSTPLLSATSEAISDWVAERRRAGQATDPDPEPAPE